MSALLLNGWAIERTGLGVRSLAALVDAGSRPRLARELEPTQKLLKIGRQRRLQR